MTSDIQPGLDGFRAVITGGASLIGAHVGDIVTAELPGGTRKLEIVAIAVYE